MSKKELISLHGQLCSLFSILLYISTLSILSAAEIKNKIYVSADVNEFGNGSKDKPYPNIQAAIDKAKPGTQILVSEGIYQEQLYILKSGKKDQWIEIVGDPNKKVVLDGSKVIVKKNKTEALILCEDVEYIKIKNIEIRNLKTEFKGAVPIGLSIQGRSSYIQCSNLKIHNIETQFKGKDNGDAHALAVYGSHESKPIENIELNNIHIFNCKLGSSEALVLNGNVEGFIIEDSLIEDCNNIGIDIIGHEGVCPNKELDQARNGIIRNNKVRKISSYGNPAYGKHHSAAGIYIDGGKNILIEKNQVSECDIGIEVASENIGRTASQVILRENIITHNVMSGILIGGYDKDQGGVEDIYLINNTLVKNNQTRWTYGEIGVQYHAKSVTIANNIFHPHHFDKKAYFITQTASDIKIENFVIDHNLYNPVAKNLIWTLQTTTKKNNFEDWKTMGFDKNSLLKDPDFTDLKKKNYRLNRTSKAIQAGLGKYHKIQNSEWKSNYPLSENIDLGAYQYSKNN